MLAPDTSLFTGFYPNADQASYAAFEAIPATIGGSEPFSYNVQIRFSSFEAGVTSGYVHSQRVLTMTTNGRWVGEVSVYYGHSGFELLVISQCGNFVLAHDLEVDRWYDVTFTWDGTNGSVYLDGGLVGTMPL